MEILKIEPDDFEIVLSLNAACVPHVNLISHDELQWFEDQAAFLRGGGSTLFPEELQLVDEVEGKSLAHLMCNSGQDSLCLARLGARVTGVDISDEAVATARRLSAETSIPAGFERADIYTWLSESQKQGRTFDIVFMSYGALVWLSDIDRWASGVGQILVPNGMLAVMDFHPVAMMLDENWCTKFPYFGDGSPVVGAEGVQDYVADTEALLAPGGYHEGVTDYVNPHAEYSFSWSMGQIVTAVIRAGLQITQFVEYPFSNACALGNGMTVDKGRRLYAPESVGDLPLMFGLAAKKER